MLVQKVEAAIKEYQSAGRLLLILMQGLVSTGIRCKAIDEELPSPCLI